MGIKFPESPNSLIVLPAHYPSLTQTERRKIREIYIEIQGQKCSHCGEYLRDDPAPDILEDPINLDLFPDGFFNYPIHLHHDHDSGFTIGAVHARCNAHLWEYHGE